jgi:hypothetical protein
MPAFAFHLFFLQLKTPAKRTRQSADPVANTPEEIPLFDLIAFPGMKEGLVFPHTFFVRKNHTFVELLSLAGKGNLCLFKTFTRLLPSGKRYRKKRFSSVLSSGISRRRRPRRNPRRGLRKRPSSMLFTGISPRDST